jgi:hypothetical protein
MTRPYYSSYCFGGTTSATVHQLVPPHSAAGTNKLTKLSSFWYNDSGDAGTGPTTLARSTHDLLIAAEQPAGVVESLRPIRRRQGFTLMTDFGFKPGILDYWMLLSDWRNGSFAILLALSVLFLGYTLVSSHKNPGGEGTKRD